MGTLFKFLFFFILYGAVWFSVFSIPVNKEENVFFVIQKALNMVPEKESDDINKKEIRRDQVIDAITKAFKP